MPAATKPTNTCFLTNHACHVLGMLCFVLYLLFRKFKVHQTNSLFAFSPLSTRMSCAVIDLFTTVIKYAHSAISSSDAHFGKSVCSMILFQSFGSSVTLLFEKVITPPGERLFDVAPKAQLSGQHFSYTPPPRPYLQRTREIPPPSARLPKP